MTTPGCPRPALTHWGPAGDLHRGSLDTCDRPDCHEEPTE